MEILFDNRQKRIEIDEAELKRKAERLLEDLDCDPEAQLSISIVDSTEMAELNQRYRNKVGPTNVLSFPQADSEGQTPRNTVLGDVVICADVASADATTLEYTIDEMALYLLIHGVLHLHGFTHDLPVDKAAMEEKVEALFQKLEPL